MDCKWQPERNEGQGPCAEAVLDFTTGPWAGPRVVEFTMRDKDSFY